MKTKLYLKREIEIRKLLRSGAGVLRVGYHRDRDEQETGTTWPGGRVLELGMPQGHFPSTPLFQKTEAQRECPILSHSERQS